MSWISRGHVKRIGLYSSLTLLGGLLLWVPVYGLWEVVFGSRELGLTFIAVGLLQLSFVYTHGRYWRFNSPKDSDTQ